eukprot:266569_1
MAVSILYDEADILRNQTVEQLESICDLVVEEANCFISSALIMAEYFETMAQRNTIQQEQWMRISERFEVAAYHGINRIKSNHVLSQLLFIPLPEKAVTIITLALQQRRLSFLNNERVLMCVQHIWNHGSPIDMVKDSKSELADQLSYYKLLRISLFSPFRFYLSPIGYHYTCCILFVSYLMYVSVYAYYIAKGQGSYIMDLILWVLNTGYICNTVSEWKANGTNNGLFSSSMIPMDIFISLVWAVLFVTNVYIFKAFSWTSDKYKNINEFVDKDWSSTVKIYILIFGIQITLLVLRCLSLFRIAVRLGEFLIIMQMMLKQVAWFMLVTFVTVGVFSSAFFFVSVLENSESSEDYIFWTRILVSFETFVGTNDEITASSAFTGLLTMCIILVLMNLFAAIITGEYNYALVEIAQKEVNYIKISTVLDLAHKHRIIPPPFNILVHPLAVMIHILIIIFSICSFHLYSKIGRRTYVFLHSCYCGCDRNKCCKTIYVSSKYEKFDKSWYHDNKWYLFTEFIGMGFCYAIKKSLNQRRRRKSNPLKRYHKGCYNSIKLEVKDEELEGKGRQNIAIAGMTMIEYIKKYENINSVTLRLSDTMLLQRLNPDTLFCDHCFQPYTERHVDMSLTTPFHVLLDFISCFLFLFTAWLPLIIFLGFMTITDYLMKIAIGTEN